MLILSNSKAYATILANDDLVILISFNSKLLIIVQEIMYVSDLSQNKGDKNASRLYYWYINCNYYIVIKLFGFYILLSVQYIQYDNHYHFTPTPHTGT